jgi:hypothetical protein
LNRGLIMQPSFDPSVDPVAFGETVGRIVLSPAGVVGVLCLAFALQAGLRLLAGAHRRPARRARPTTWTRF